jgi:uncharacterized protein (DUF362 family)
MLGYERMAEKKRVRLTNLTLDQNENTSVNIGNASYQFSVPKTIAEADLLISVAKIKYMPKAKISCTLKNIFGCNPYPRKYEFHKKLNETIVGLNKIMKPSLCIIDGIVVKGITTKRLGLIMAATDPVAIDAAASKIAGINPLSVRHLILASREKIGNISFTPLGEPLSLFRTQFPKKTIRYKTLRALFTIYKRFL